MTGTQGENPHPNSGESLVSYKALFVYSDGMSKQTPVNQQSDRFLLAVAVRTLRILWRIANTVLLPILFFAPWLASCGENQMNGYETIYWFGAMGTASLIDPWNAAMAGPFLSISIGLTLLLAYSLTNLIAMFWKHNRWFLLVFLFAGVSAMSTMLGLAVSMDVSALGGFLWGFWATLATITSGILLETTELVVMVIYQQQRQRQNPQLQLKEHPRSSA